MLLRQQYKDAMRVIQLAATGKFEFDVTQEREILDRAGVLLQETDEELKEIMTCPPMLPQS